jgi:hypothetical protein
MRPVWASIVRASLLASAVLAGAVGAAPAVRLRHQTAPGSVAVYRVHVAVQRRALDPSEARSQPQIQTGTLTRVIFRENEPDQPTCAQMLELQASDVFGPAAEKGTVPMSPDPVGEERAAGTATRPPSGPNGDSPLARRGDGPRAQLSVARISAESAPLAVPATTAWTRAAWAVAIDVTTWPPRRVSVGETWETPFRAGPISGDRHYLVEAIKHKGSDQHVVLQIRAAPEPTPAGAPRVLQSAESKLVWSVRDHELISLDGRVVYQSGAGEGGWETTAHLEYTRVSRTPLTPPAQEAERDALIGLTQAVAAYQRDDVEDALQRSERFAGRWPRSRWRPVADYLIRRITTERIGREPMPTEELEHALVRLLELWESAAEEGDVDILEKCRLSFAHLAQVNRPEIMRLLEGREGRWRAVGCFALAFGGAPADLVLIEDACGDGDVQVRRMAMSALAIRGSPLVNGDVILTGLRDHDTQVRRRACDAAGACVSEQAGHLDRVRALLVDRLTDESLMVVVAAARALMRIGSAAEIAQIHQAIERAESNAVKAALQALVEAKTGTADGRR